MDVKAAVAFKAGEPLRIETVQLGAPREGEVLVEIKATGLCHTDKYTLSGADPEGLFPAILGHEGAGVVVETGPGVRHLKPGDHVIPLYTPECRECKSCLSRKTNLCTSIRSTQGKGLMPDGTSRFSFKGQPVHHYMGCSTFANYTVLPEIALAKIRPDAPFDKVCYIGCGVTTGIGAVLFTAQVEAGSTVVVFGLGGIGLNVIQGAKMVGADRIIGVDLNPAREEIARKFGMTEFVNPADLEQLQRIDLDRNLRNQVRNPTHTFVSGLKKSLTIAVFPAQPRHLSNALALAQEAEATNARGIFAASLAKLVEERGQKPPRQGLKIREITPNKTRIINIVDLNEN